MGLNFSKAPICGWPALSPLIPQLPCRWFGFQVKHPNTTKGIAEQILVLTFQILLAQCYVDCIQDRPSDRSQDVKYMLDYHKMGTGFWSLKIEDTVEVLNLSIRERDELTLRRPKKLLLQFWPGFAFARAFFAFFLPPKWQQPICVSFACPKFVMSRGLQSCVSIPCVTHHIECW